MWTYSKKLEYPVKIARPDAAAAKVIISQLGGPDGEMGAATRYLSQRYTAPWGQVKAGLTDSGMEAYFVDHPPASIRRRHPVCRFLLQPCNRQGTSSAI